MIAKPGKKAKKKTKIAPSIMQDKKECYITGATHGLHRHEVYFGNPNRDKSLEWGCWVFLKAEYHNQSNKGVHFNRKLDLQLKRLTQRKFEELYSRDKFVEVFGKSYL